MSQVFIGACISDMYLVVNGKHPSLVVQAKYVEGACDPIPENDYTFCGALSYDNCDRCDSRCRLAVCRNRKEEDLADLCLPNDVSMNEIKDRCFSVMGAVSYDWKEECKHAEADQSSAWTIVLILLFVLLFLAFIGSVGFYHWRLRKTGEAPIKCPRFCPQALFPQPEVRQPARSSSAYRPPEFYSD
jgi:hypothetical protein